MLGYDSNSRAYCVFNNDSSCVETTCDVVFDETNGSQVEQYQPSSNEATPPIQDDDQNQEGEQDEDDDQDHNMSNDQGGVEQDEDKDDQDKSRLSPLPHPRVSKRSKNLKGSFFIPNPCWAETLRAGLARTNRLPPRAAQLSDTPD
jgi:hypothetical protein